MKVTFSVLFFLLLFGTQTQAQVFSWVQIFPIFAYFGSDPVPVSNGSVAFQNPQEAPALQLTTFPNPAQDWVVVSSPADMEQIALFDSAGRLLYSARSGRTVQKLDLSRFPAGTYWVRVTSKGHVAGWKTLKKL